MGHRWKRLWPAILLAILVSTAAPGQQPGQENPQREITALRTGLEQLRAEVARLRKQVAELELGRHREVIQRIQADLDSLRMERDRLAEIDRTRQQDLHDIEELLGRTDMPGEERSDLEVARVELAVTKVREIDRQSDAVRVRESELVRHLETEEQLAKRLEEALNPRGGKPQ